MAGEQDADRTVERPPGPSDLLVVGDDRAGRLEVHDEAEVGLVVAHAERGRGHHGLELVALQPRLDRLLRLRLLGAEVRGRGDAVVLEPAGDERRVANGERVDDPATFHPRQRVDQPREALRLRREVHDVERQALALERAADEHEIVAELRDDVVDDAVVGGRGGAEHGHVGRQEIEHAGEPAVVGAEVVAPVADAVRLVDHEQPDARRDLGQDVAAELGVGEALG